MSEDWGGRESGRGFVGTVRPVALEEERGYGVRRENLGRSPLDSGPRV